MTEQAYKVTDLENKKIMLLRHAEALNTTFSVNDFNRSLSHSGQQQAKSIGQKIHQHVTSPISVACSTAVRTRQTLEALNINNIFDVHYYESLYNGDLTDYLEVITKASNFPLLLIGHNPVISELATILRRTDDTTIDYSGFMAPANLVAINFPQNPTDKYIKNGTITAFESP